MRGVMRTLEQVLRYLLAFSVWLGGAYLLAIINDGLFAIFLGSSMIIVGMYIPPRGGQTDRAGTFILTVSLRTRRAVTSAALAHCGQ